MGHNFYNIVLSITAISRDLYNKVHTLTKRPLKESIDRDFWTKTINFENSFFKTR